MVRKLTYFVNLINSMLVLVSHVLCFSGSFIPNIYVHESSSMFNGRINHDFDLKVPDMIHNIITELFSNPLRIWYQKFSHIFVFTSVVKFGMNVTNTSGEINGNVAWKLENVATTLNKTINNISTMFSYYFKTRYKFAVFFIVDEIFRWKLTLSASFSKINFSKFSCQAPLTFNPYTKFDPTSEVGLNEE